MAMSYSGAKCTLASHEPSYLRQQARKELNRLSRYEARKAVRSAMLQPEECYSSDYDPEYADLEVTYLDALVGSISQPVLSIQAMVSWLEAYQPTWLSQAEPEAVGYSGVFELSSWKDDGLDESDEAYSALFNLGFNSKYQPSAASVQASIVAGTVGYDSDQPSQDFSDDCWAKPMTERELRWLAEEKPLKHR